MIEVSKKNKVVNKTTKRKHRVVYNFSFDNPNS